MPSPDDNLLTWVASPDSPVEYAVTTPTILKNAALGRDAPEGSKAFLMIKQQGSQETGILCALAANNQSAYSPNLSLPLGKVVIFSVEGNSSVSLLALVQNDAAPHGPALNSGGSTIDNASRLPEVDATHSLGSGVKTEAEKSSARAGTPPPHTGILDEHSHRVTARKRGVEDLDEPELEVGTASALVPETSSSKRQKGEGGATIPTASTPAIRIFDVVTGNGKPVNRQSQLIMKFRATVEGFAVFSQSVDPPAKMSADSSRMVLGWRQGILGMRERGRRVIVVPPELGYGDKEVPAKGGKGIAIPRGSTLVIDCYIVAVDDD